MPVIPIDLPAGMMRNGTEYSARGRWADGNLVRWHDGALRPIGGWQRRRDAADNRISLPSTGSDEVYRDSISYTTASGENEALFFSNKRVIRMKENSELTDVTPDGYTQGLSEPTAVSGYGTGAYGREVYGVRRTAANRTTLPVHRVNSDMWGENVLFAVQGVGPIYEYVPSSSKAVEIAAAPTDVEDIIVTDQRIVMAIKNSPEVRQLLWSDREDNADWTPTVSNYADVRTLQGTGKLLGLYKMQNQILILSTTDAQVGRFIGAPFVYGFERVGQGCAPLHQAAVAKEERFAVWMGKRNFWIYDGTLKQLPCEVTDFVYNELSIDNISKIHSTSISDFSEVWWFYQDNASDLTATSSYVTFDFTENHWATGQLERSTAFDSGVFEYPIMVSAFGNVFNHEQVGVKVNGAAFCVSGPLELDGGNRNMAVRYVFPDTTLPNSVSLSFTTRQMPSDVDVSHGPFEYMNPTSTTGVLGREVRMTVTGLTSTWEVGTMRFDVQAVGGGLR